ncbi:sugar phosphate isomerase/epimerase [Actinokineospora sp. NBRC 105648]|uniref:sugar phosphate isomerase/epimerase family protein n=1 Tax=Actinokineospora sp. NBRC 105648 TaxID=3032206 RepID=UPI002553A852|nr:sugar phosphate isomerase/epimerase [Actinokineospora sp. NBRC 105648]
MAALTWPLSEELSMYQRLGADLVGLPATKLATHGWPAALGEITLSEVEVEYLVHACQSDPNDEVGWVREVRSMLTALDQAAKLGARTLYLTVGPSGSLTWEQAATLFVGRMRPVVERAGELGIALALENTSPVRSDLSFIHTVRDAAELARVLDVGLCVDLYCCWQERDLMTTLGAAVERIKLVQVSDFRLGTMAFPNRWVPGDGDLPLTRLLADVLGIGYGGVVDIELIGPAIEAEGPENALRRALAWTTAQLA